MLSSKEKKTKYAWEWKEKNREYLRKYSRDYYKDPIHNQKKRTSLHRSYLKYGLKYRLRMKKRREEVRDSIIKILGGHCKKCGFRDKRALQIDHVFGCGISEIKHHTSIYYNHVFEELNKGTDKYQLLCANCNWIKRYENKEQPQIKGI